MDVSAFRRSLEDPAPPGSLPLGLLALWWDGKGDWNRAHSCAQEHEDKIGAAVHAYLHRKEGDLTNARYWYARADRTPATGALDSEWADLVGELLAPQGRQGLRP